ncbi:MAG: bifunctional adenosylcobinamide kinase/adenosylcobinamide-phosphate guanylyltransferase [Hyphomicrobiales bacterium]
MSITLVLGGARSGKSGLAESLCRGERHYIATAQAFDSEMKDRIAAHQKQRGAGWVTHEVVLDLPEALKAADGAGRVLLVDCLTLWLSNLMLAEADWLAMTEVLVAALPGLRADVVLVSNEVGLSIVPENALARRFRDAQGTLNQRVAQAADKVIFVAAGLPLTLKG